MNELALFAGAGGGILGGKLLGWRTVCAVEINEYARNVLLARQDDGSIEPFPVWDDVRTFDGKPWRGVIDVVSGGFPCQDISAANPNGDGLEGERSGLWREMARIVCEVVPRFVFVENSPMLLVRGLDRVLGELACMGYDARWGVLGGQCVDAAQQRERIWILACNDVQWLEKRRKHKATSEVGRTKSDNGSGSTGNVRRVVEAETDGSMGLAGRKSGWWEIEPRLGRVADGLADWLDRIKAIGNGQIPVVAASAWRILS